MSTAPVTSQLAIVTAGEPTLFDSLARLVPEELQTEYYRVLAHTRTLSPDDEMLRILEAMGILALLTPLCAKMSETSIPSIITVGRGKKSHFDKHEQDKLFLRCVGSFGA